MKTMKRLVGVIVVALMFTVTAAHAEEPEVFEYYDADSEMDCVDYYYGDTTGELYDSFSYYNADDNTYVTEYYYYSDYNSEEDDYSWCPDYGDLYFDEYQAAWYSPVCVNNYADFYSLSGEYICTIPKGTYVQPIESIGRSGDISYITYNGYYGYVFTTLLLDPPYVICSEPTYDEIFQSGDGYVVQLLTTVNLRDENGNILTTIPAGYAVEVVKYDYTTGRCWVRWNGWFGSIISTAIWSGSDSSYVDHNEECYDEGDEGFGYAKIEPLVGANVRDCDNNIIIAVPCGETVKLLENLNNGGRTLIEWGSYRGTILTSTLKVYSA